MAPPALVVVITVALGTLLALALAIVALLHRLRDLSGRLQTVKQRLEPESEALDQELQAAQRQLDELGEAVQGLRGRPGRPRVH